MDFLDSFNKAMHWSESQFAGLPWRTINRTLYSTAVSEFMLQQTVVGTVLKKFPTFMQLFPSWIELAKASEAEVVKAWEGLGYYRRARLLHKLAQAVVANSPVGDLPLEIDALMAYPGIGPYTANAIRGIGGNRPSLSLDTNLQRVLGRFFGLKNSFTREDLQKVWPNYFTQCSFSYRTFLESLMDVGRIYCQQNKVDCGVCPLRDHCLAAKKKIPLSFGVKSKTQTQSSAVNLLRLQIMGPSCSYFYQKKDKEWLKGQWEFLTFSLSAPELKSSIGHQYPEISFEKFKSNFLQNPMAIFKTTITKYKFTNLVYCISYRDFQHWIKHHPKALQDYAKRLVKIPAAKELDLHLSSATLKGLNKRKEKSVCENLRHNVEILLGSFDNKYKRQLSE